MSQIRKSFSFGSNEEGLTRQQKYQRVAKLIYDDEEAWGKWLRTLADKEADRLLKKVQEDKESK